MKKSLLKTVFAVLLLVIFACCTISAHDNTEEYDYTSEPEGYLDTDISYHYEVNEYGANELVGLTYGNQYFRYIYNESDVIVGISDANDVQIVSYTYDENELPNGVYSLQENK